MQWENRKEADLDSGLDLGTESFDVYGGAVVLLERQLVPVGGFASLETSFRATTLERVSLVVHCGAGVLLEHRQHAV